MKIQEPLAWDQVQALLTRAQIPLAPAKLVQNRAEAVHAANDLGYPVAVKGISSHYTHKTEMGLVVLDCDTPEAVQKAVGELERRIERHFLEGFLVQKMVRGGVEMIVGVHHDPQFGPLVLAGGGGTLVELYEDTALRLAPISPVQAEDLLRETRSWRLLEGFRGKPRVDIAALVDLLVKVGELAAAPNQQAFELDLNPVIVLPEGAWVADFRMILEGEQPEVK